MKFDLFISSNKINADCSKVIELLKLNNFECNVTPNVSVIKKNNMMIKENGCHIIFNNIDPNTFKKTLWEKIKKNSGLNCAYMEYKNYKGCIYKYK